MEKQLEEKIFEQFIKKMGKEVEGLDLFPALEEDSWDDDEPENLCLIMEKEDNGRVWECSCTKSGKIKTILEIE